jgi:long-subunit fatty acid transport protein
MPCGGHRHWYRRYPVCRVNCLTSHGKVRARGRQPAPPVHAGLVAGFGGEYAVMPNWSVKLEYDYIRMAQQTVAMVGTGVFNAVPIENAQLFNKVNQDLHLVKFGVNYHFNPLPVVVAKY